MPASYDKKSILIVSTPENGLAEMFSGYMLHYSNQDIAIALLPANRAVPQHIHDILKEDGIHITYPPDNALVAHFDVGVVFNDFEFPGVAQSKKLHKLNIESPLVTTKDAWRPVREEVKKLAISILGDMLRHHK